MAEDQDPEFLRGELIKIGELLTAAGIEHAAEDGQSEAKRLERLLRLWRPKGEAEK